MAECNWCHQEMLHVTTTTCTEQIVTYPDGSTAPAIPYPYEEDRRCHDCRVVPGGYHHPGCDMEQCPKCEGQLIGCGCFDEGKNR